MASLTNKSCNFALVREFPGDKSWVVRCKLRNSSVKCGLSSRLIDLETKMHITCGYNFKRLKEGRVTKKFYYSILNSIGFIAKEAPSWTLQYIPKCNISIPKIVGDFLV